MSNIQLENGRINLEGLSGISDHLKALAITNKTLDAIKSRLESTEDKESEWFQRATAAHKAWFWMRSRICERLAILRRAEKEMNIMRNQFEKEELLKILSDQQSPKSLRELRMLAQAKAELRMQNLFSEGGE